MKSNASLFICALALLVGQEAKSQSGNCAALKTIAGDSCEKLSINLDLSKCGGSSYEKSKVDFCSPEKFQVSTILGSKTYTMSGATKMWNGKMTWDTSTFKFSEKVAAQKSVTKTDVKAGTKTAARTVA